MSSEAGRRLRLTVDGVDGGVFGFGPDDVAAGSASVAGVRELPASADERASGVRRFEVTVDGWVFTVTVEQEARAQLRERASQGNGGRRRRHSDVVRAQITGRVVRLWVAEGDTVEAGQRLLAVEAMKMENEVRAPHGGTVDRIRVAAGSSVELGDELVTLR